MAPGDVILVRTAGLFGRLIRYGESRRYGPGVLRVCPAYWNHAALVVDASGTLIEASRRGVIVTQYGEDRDWLDYVVVTPPYEEGAAERAVAAMYELVGNGYDWLAILCEALTLLTGSRLRFGVRGTQICSGAVAYALTRADIDLGSDPEWLSPADLRWAGHLWPAEYAV